MAREPSPAILDPLRRLVTRQTGSALTDAQLLENFVARRDEASFEVLVWRHGAMVLALCKRVLRDSHEAEDAFQATFLVFARKASNIGRGEVVAAWLYKVAYRVALRLRAAAEKRAVTGEPTNAIPAPEAACDADWLDLKPVLDDEIARLPEKYRAPFVLCYLEGRTNEEAAAALGCPKGTVLSRLSRGRERLRERLSRRGVALSATAFALTLSHNAASALGADRPRDFDQRCGRPVCGGDGGPTCSRARRRSRTRSVEDHDRDQSEGRGGAGGAGRTRNRDRVGRARRCRFARTRADPGARGARGRSAER